MAQSELDKLLKAFEEKNTSMEFYILMSSEGIPFKSNIVEQTTVVKIAGLIYDLILYAKRTLDDLKKTNVPQPGQSPNGTMRMRLKNGEEIIVVQEGDIYLISKQICKLAEQLEEPEKK